MKTQEEFLKEILELKAANPALEIHFCVDSHEICDSGWTFHKITKISVDPWVEANERIMTDEDEIKDYFAEAFNSESVLSEEELEIVEQRYNSEVKFVICVYTKASQGE